jgi:hypothetical protein
MSDFTPRQKETIERALREMNAKLREAIRKTREGKYEEAAALVAGAIDLKHDNVVTSFPTIPDDKGKEFSFENFYNLFHEMDGLAELARARIELDPYVGPGTITLHDLSARIKNAIDELKLLMRQYTFEEDGLGDLFREMLRRLEEMHAAVNRFINGQPVDLDVFLGLSELKRQILTILSDKIPLWDLYVLLDELDAGLEGCHRTLNRDADKKPPPDSRPVRMLIRALESLEAVKAKLEALVRGLKPVQPPKPPKPGQPGVPLVPETPPAPDYPPGSEDLPPFPPPDYASTGARKGGKAKAAKSGKKGGRR